MEVGREWEQESNSRTPLVNTVELDRLLVPESPRWLAVHGHYDTVLPQIRNICRINGRQLPEDFHPKCLVEEVIDYIINYVETFKSLAE